jgi:membrane protease subunit HflK
MIPKAEGEADAILERAMAYKDKTIKNAVGETSRFNQVYESYVLAKEITRTRIFLEVMEDIYMNANKIIMEGTTMEKTTPYVPVSPNLLKGGSN